MTRFVNGGLSIPSMTTSSWLSASPPMPPPMPGKVKLRSPLRRVCSPDGPTRSGARCSNIRSRQRRVSRIRSPLGWSERACRGTAAERLPAHPDGVDLVDEDDALAAPLAGESLRLPGEVADDDRVDPDEGRS